MALMFYAIKHHFETIKKAGTVILSVLNLSVYLSKKILRSGCGLFRTEEKICNET